MTKILVSGGCGQIGTDLVPELQKKYGKENIITNDLREPESWDGILEIFDFQDVEKVEEVIKKHNITVIYHLACILSAAGEKIPYKTWEVNMQTLRNVLDLAVKYNLKIFWPSSIAVFGPSTPRDKTPQDTVMEPTTMYGITKRAGEMLCNYYHKKFGVDVRSVRYPGLISYKQEPGGGTTDYAVEIFYDSLKGKPFSCFVGPETTLPMMYMDDAIRASIELMEAPAESIKIRTSYNLTAMSFSAEELEREVRKHIPALQVAYNPDKRQKIADSWPASIDDTKAREEWGWQHKVDLPEMTKIMIDELKRKFDGEN
ncbi:MAG: NAD-dependent epimerase/dehydratase family protein [Candidatus Woesearchaeota archaeon]|nr:NAD-dependent epimerase/dehydratase family protein [Candidatus Woesearchaeota archaeon]